MKVFSFPKSFENLEEKDGITRHQTENPLKHHRHITPHQPPTPHHTTLYTTPHHTTPHHTTLHLITPHHTTPHHTTPHHTTPHHTTPHHTTPNHTTPHHTNHTTPHHTTPHHTTPHHTTPHHTNHTTPHHTTPHHLGCFEQSQALAEVGATLGTAVVRVLNKHHLYFMHLWTLCLLAWCG